MAKRLPLTDSEGEVRKLTISDFKHFKTAAEVLPDELCTLLPKRGRPLAKEPKQAVSIRLSPDIVATFKSTGKGWQTRVNNALREWLQEHKSE
jgi:uncharacterized protein (DUF4415 family)